MMIIHSILLNLTDCGECL